jgi:hypothetical protein
VRPSIILDNHKQYLTLTTLYACKSKDGEGSEDTMLTLTDSFCRSYSHKAHPSTINMTSSPTMSKKRGIKPEPDTSTSEPHSPSPETPSKKARTTPTQTKTASPKKSSTKADAWIPELRLKLFEAYESSSQVKWDEVARKVGPSMSCLLSRRWKR